METINSLMSEIKYAAESLKQDCADLRKPYAGMIDVEGLYEAEQERNIDHANDQRINES